MGNSDLQNVENKEIALLEPSAAIIEVAARLQPRNMVKVENSIREVACSSPKMAKACVYCRPVGKNKEGHQTFALGPSVRWAELAQQQMGRLWINGDCIIVNGSAKAKVMCFDLISLNVTFGHASKSVMRKSGGMFSDSQIEVTSNALLSIARRNAILQQCRAQWEAMESDVKRTIITELCKDDTPDNAKLKTAWNTLVEMFGKLGVSQAQLKTAMAAESDAIDKLVLLVGIYNAIQDELVTVYDVFGSTQDTPRSGPQNIKPTTAKKPEAPKAAPEPEPEQEQEPEREPGQDDEEPPPEEPEPAPEPAKQKSKPASKKADAGFIKTIKDLKESTGMGDDHFALILKEVAGIESADDIPDNEDVKTTLLERMVG